MQATSSCLMAATPRRAAHSDEFAKAKKLTNDIVPRRPRILFARRNPQPDFSGIPRVLDCPDVLCLASVTGNSTISTAHARSCMPLCPSPKPRRDPDLTDPDTTTIHHLLALTLGAMLIANFPDPV